MSLDADPTRERLSATLRRKLFRTRLALGRLRAREERLLELVRLVDALPQEEDPEPKPTGGWQWPT
jgi:hypothetical protein